MAQHKTLCRLPVELVMPQNAVTSDEDRRAGNSRGPLTKEDRSSRLTPTTDGRRGCPTTDCTNRIALYMDGAH